MEYCLIDNSSATFDRKLLIIILLLDIIIFVQLELVVLHELALKWFHITAYKFSTVVCLYPRVPSS
jgi:hypothetical protein